MNHWSRLIPLAVAIVLGVCSSCSDSPNDAGPDDSASASPSASLTASAWPPASDGAGKVTIEDGRKMFSSARDRVADRGPGGRRRRHQPVLRLRLRPPRGSYQNVHLRPGEPRTERPGFSVPRPPGARERPRTVPRAGQIPALTCWSEHPGGGHITAGYAIEHATQIAGMVLVEVPPPFPNPPADLVAETQCNAPGNIESRDYLRVEREAWQARRKIGDIPVTVISNRYSPGEVAAAPPIERPLLRANVEPATRLAGVEPAGKAGRSPHRSRGRGVRPRACDRRDTRRGPRCASVTLGRQSAMPRSARHRPVPRLAVTATVAALW